MRAHHGEVSRRQQHERTAVRMMLARVMCGVRMRALGVLGRRRPVCARGAGSAQRE
jgi:hypothetical protein